MEVIAERKVTNRIKHALVEQGWREIVRNRRLYEKKKKKCKAPREKKSLAQCKDYRWSREDRNIFFVINTF